MESEDELPYSDSSGSEEIDPLIEFDPFHVMENYDNTIEALRDSQVSHPTARRWNRSINREIRQIRQLRRAFMQNADADIEFSASQQRKQQEQQIRIRRYKRMRWEINQIMDMSNPEPEDINDLRDYIRNAENLYRQIGEHIRTRRQLGFKY